MKEGLEPQPRVFNGNSPGRLPAVADDRFTQAASLRRNVSRFFTSLRKRWWVFVVSLLVIGGPAVYYARLLPPRFESRAIMWIGTQPNLSESRLYPEGVTSYIGTQAQLFKSGIIQQRAIAKLRERFPELAGFTNSPPFELSVRTSLKASILELKATGPSPASTQAFVDEIMKEYAAFKVETRKQSSSGALSSLTGEIKQVEGQVQELQNRLTRFQVANNISYLTEHGLSAGSHLARLQELVSDLKTEHRLLDLLSPDEFRSLSQNSDLSPSTAVVPGERASRALAVSGAAPQTAKYQAMQQLQLLKSRRDEFAKVLRPTHTKMQRLNQEIGGLEQLLKQLDDEGEEQAMAQMKNRKKALDLQIENLESQYRTWETNAAEASAKLAEYDLMKQEMQRSQALYDRLLSLLQTVDLGKIDQEPLVPLGPATPAKPTLTRYGIAAAGLFLGALAGAGIFFVLGLFDDRFVSARELTLQLPAEVMATIPRGAAGVLGRSRPLLVTNEAQDPFAEAFRTLRSSLLFGVEAGEKTRVILVTSAIPKEGKSTVATNLAATLAAAGSPVILVDADVRRGCLHRFFEVSHEPGLLDVLANTVSVDEATVATSQPNLSLLPSGTGPNGMGDALVGSRMDLLLAGMARRYRYIIIDSAPVLATDDAATLGPRTDGVFLVVRASYTSSQLTEEALERLRRRNINVLGMIYNFASSSGGYYGRYSRDYFDTKRAGAA